MSGQTTRDIDSGGQGSTIDEGGQGSTIVTFLCAVC